uniref:GATOR2 complex protein WDR24 n=1 Tax=Mesocestoides corti TaxID=53468 RepID=A0A5K3FE05_MESCO
MLNAILVLLMSDSRGVIAQSPEVDTDDANDRPAEARTRPRGVSNKTWVFDAGDPLVCIAISSSHPLLAVAGRNLLQILRVEEDKFVSIHRLKNLHRNISTKAPTNAAKANPASAMASHFQSARSYAINDVAWSDTQTTLATCTNAGDLIIWDLSRGINQSVCLVGNSRSVHRIHFNPNAPNELISASHDGNIRLFDIRDQSYCRIFQVRTTAPSPVRDVVYCPHEGHIFAGAFENGLVGVWDTRNESRPARCFQGHTCVTASIDWHPHWNSIDRNWLATAGGRDNMIKVWDLNRSCPTAVYSLRAKNTGHVRWRLGEATQVISSCSLSLDLSIHLWELNRPYIPYVTFEGHSHTISGICWSNDHDAFYSVSRDGLLLRHHIEGGIQPVRGANPVALALNCHGPVAHAIGGEPGLRVMAELKRSPSTVGDQASLLHRTISEATMRTPHQLLVTRRSIQAPLQVYLPPDSPGDTSLSEATPPSIIPPDVFVAQGRSELFEATFMLKQSAELSAAVSSLVLPDVFIHLAKHYRIAGGCVEEVCDHNSSVARHVHQDFLSQFWLTLKMIYGHTWQYLAASNQKPAADTPSKRRPEDEKPLSARASSTPRRPPLPNSSSTQTYAEVASRRSSGVCVLDFIVRHRTPDDGDDKFKIDEIDNAEEKPEVETPMSAKEVASDPGMVKTPQQIAETGSLGRSVNFLFDGGRTISPPTPDPKIRARTVGLSSIPSEADANLFVGASEATGMGSRKASLECSRKLESKSSVEESANQKRSRNSRETAEVEKPKDQVALPSSRAGSLDLTSAADCLGPVDTALLETFTYPLDFSHLIGPWFLELVEAGHVQTVCTALVALGTERTRINEWATEKQIESWFYSYLDVLVRFRLWSVSTRLIKHCGGLQGGIVEDTTFASPATSTPAIHDGRSKPKDQMFPRKQSLYVPPKSGALPLARHIAILNQTGTSVSIRCGKCSKPMQRPPVASTPSPVTPQSTGSTLQTASASSMTPSHAAWACSRHTSAETSLSTCAVCHMTVRGIYLWCIGCSHGGHLDHIREWITRRRECPAGCGHYCEYGKLDGSVYIQISA